MVTGDNIKHCFYCEREFVKENYGTNKPLARTRDHIIPLCKNGSNKACNMVYACVECNHFKGDLLLDLFLIKVQNYIDNNNSFKSTPKKYLPIIISKIELLKIYVGEKGNALYNKKPRYGSIVGSYLKRHAADVKLSVNTNTSRLSSDENIIYLQQQTVDQFKEKKRLDEVVKRQLALPDPNFHEINQVSNLPIS